MPVIVAANKSPGANFRKPGNNISAGRKIIMGSVKKNKVKRAVRNSRGDISGVPFNFFNSRGVAKNNLIKLFFMNRLYFFWPVLIFKIGVPTINGQKVKIRTPRKNLFNIEAILYANFSANRKVVVKNYF